MNAAIVVIPTTGAPELEQAIQSVLEQTVPCDVLVIFDGSAYARPLALPPAANVFVMTLPFNTGKARTGLLQEGLPRHWFGARVQTAAAYIVNNDYVMILDQDNWLQPNHVESCMAKLDSRPAAPSCAHRSGESSTVCMWRPSVASSSPASRSSRSFPPTINWSSRRWCCLGISVSSSSVSVRASRSPPTIMQSSVRWKAASRRRSSGRRGRLPAFCVELRAEAFQHSGPLTAVVLPVESRTWIPGAVSARQQPTPVRRRR